MVYTHLMCVSISYSMKNNSPCYQFVMSVNMPQCVGSRHTIFPPQHFLSNTVPHPLSQLVNAVDGIDNTLLLNLESMCSTKMPHNIGAPSGWVFFVVSLNQVIKIGITDVIEVGINSQFIFSCLKCFS